MSKNNLPNRPRNSDVIPTEVQQLIGGELRTVTRVDLAGDILVSSDAILINVSHCSSVNAAKDMMSVIDL